MATPIQHSRNTPPTTKAWAHQVVGAGRSRVLRRFLGLAPQDVPQIRELLVRGITQKVKRGR